MSFYYPLPQAKKSKVTYDCDKCGLCASPKVHTKKFPFVKGKNYSGLVILGQQPSKEDDNQSIPFSNERAKVIRAEAFKAGLNLLNTAAFVYALKGYSNKKGTEVQFKCCRELMVNELKELKPKMIVCCGEMAFKSLFDLKNKVSALKLRGRLIPNFEFNCLVYTLMNPNEVYNYNYQFALKRDFKRALKFYIKYSTYKKVKAFLKERKILEGITIKEIKNTAELHACLDRVSRLKRVAFDYETTNVKPYDNNFEITHIQFGTAKYAWVLHESLWTNNWMSDEESYFNENWDIIMNFMNEWLPDPSVEKLIQNVKFERNCSRWVFGAEIVNTQDPMIASHVIDERRGTTSLDFQNLTRFGIPPYSETVKSFMQKKNKDDKVNRIREAPYYDLIIYAGLDVITTYNQWKVIEKYLPFTYPNAKSNYEFLHRGHKLFANMSQAGIKIGQDELNELETTLKDKMDKVLTKISEIPEFINYNKYLEDKTNLNKSTEKKLKKLLIKMEGDGTYESIKERNKRRNKPIRRKLSF